MLGLHFRRRGNPARRALPPPSFQQSAAELIARGETFGWPFSEAVASGIRHHAPVEISLDASGADLRRAAVDEQHMQWVVVDSIAEPAARGTSRFPDYLSALTGLFASVGKRRS